MDFLGVGPLELGFILLLALIIFGPNDIVKAGKTLGRFMRKVVTSDGWQAFQQARKGISNIPNQLMREAGLEEEELRRMSGLDDIEAAAKDLENATGDLQNQISTWTTPPAQKSTKPANPAKESTPEEGSQPETESVASEPEQEVAAKPEEPAAPSPDSPFSETIHDND